MKVNIDIEIKGEIDVTEVHLLKDYVLEFSRKNSVDSYSFRAKDNLGMSVE